jgi:2-polyprenyl-6-methoxyphenol hydroxylase-like FAD-dependent oxidoreductase
MADVPDDEPSRRVSLYCEPGGIVESFPLPEGRRRWVVADPLNRLRDGAAFAREIEERTGVRPHPTLPPTAFRAQQHRAVRAAAGRVVLLGDALHETSPIGGQGMNLGWNGARRLAAAIGRSLRGAAPDFSAYERSALLSAARAQRRSWFYMTMGLPARGVPLVIRNTVIRALGSPPLRGSAADLITMRGL